MHLQRTRLALAQLASHLLQDADRAVLPQAAAEEEQRPAHRELENGRQWLAFAITSLVVAPCENSVAAIAGVAVQLDEYAPTMVKGVSNEINFDTENAIEEGTCGLGVHALEYRIEVGRQHRSRAQQREQRHGSFQRLRRQQVGAEGVLQRCLERVLAPQIEQILSRLLELASG